MERKHTHTHCCTIFPVNPATYDWTFVTRHYLTKWYQVSSGSIVMYGLPLFLSFVNEHIFFSMTSLLLYSGPTSSPNIFYICTYCFFILLPLAFVGVPEWILMYFCTVLSLTQCEFPPCCLPLIYIRFLIEINLPLASI